MPETTISQSKLTQLMHQLGYQTVQEGVCFGLCEMAKQALLTGHLDEFMERIQFLEQLALSTPSDHQLELPEEKRVEILAFFDGIQLLQQPYIEGIEEPGQWLWQKTRTRSKLAHSIEMEQIKKKEVILTVTDRNQERTKKQLELILKYYGNQPFSLYIGTENHATTLLNSPHPAPGVLTFFDPNFIPPQLTRQNLDEIVEQIYDTLEFDSLSLEMSSLDNDENVKAYQYLTADAEWRRLKEGIEATGVQFLNAYMLNDLQTCEIVVKGIEQKGGNLSYVLSSNIPCYSAYLAGVPFDKIYKNKIASFVPRVNVASLTDKKLALAAVKIDGTALEGLSDHFGSDEEVVLAAYAQNPSSLKYAQSDLVKKLLFNKEVSIKHAPKELKHDVNLVASLYKDAPTGLDKLEILVDLSTEQVLEVEKNERLHHASAYLSLFKSYPNVDNLNGLFAHLTTIDKPHAAEFIVNKTGISEKKLLKLAFAILDKKSSSLVQQQQAMDLLARIFKNMTPEKSPLLLEYFSSHRNIMLDFIASNDLLISNLPPELQKDTEVFLIAFNNTRLSPQGFYDQFPESFLELIITQKINYAYLPFEIQVIPEVFRAAKEASENAGFLESMGEVEVSATIGSGKEYFLERLEDDVVEKMLDYGELKPEELREFNLYEERIVSYENRKRRMINAASVEINTKVLGFDKKELDRFFDDEEEDEKLETNSESPGFSDNQEWNDSKTNSLVLSDQIHDEAYEVDDGIAQEGGFETEVEPEVNPTQESHAEDIQDSEQSKERFHSYKTKFSSLPHPEQTKEEGVDTEPTKKPR